MIIQEWGETARRTLDVFRSRKQDYQHTFLSPAGQRVLVDLARFCRANDSCFDADPRLHAVAEGQRRVWLRIQKYLNFSPEELYQLYSGLVPLKPKEK